MTEEAERVEIDRDILITTTLSATTPEQCGRAEERIIAWIKMHPRDFGILGAGGQLAMISDRFDRPSGEVRIMLAA